MLRQNLKYFVIILFVLFTSSCTREEQGKSSTISISLSKTSSGFSKITTSSVPTYNSTFQSVSSSNVEPPPDWNESLNPTEALLDTDGLSNNNVNCIGVMITGPEPDMRRNLCTDSENGNSFPVGRWIGGFPVSSGNVSIQVPSGIGRVIRVIGFYAQNGACKNMKGTPVDSQNLSKPHVIGVTTKDLQSGVVPVAVSIPNTIQETNSFSECRGPDFDIKSENNLFFGNALDNTDYDRNMSGTTYPLTNGFFSSGVRNLATGYMKVTGIVGGSLSDPTGTVINVAGGDAAQFGTNPDFGLQDEVMIIIMGSSGAPINTPNLLPQEKTPCGYRGFSGRYMFARMVQKITATQFKISKGTFLDNLHFGQLSEISNINPNLAAAFGSASFCTIQVVKIPHFRNLDITDQTLSAPPFTLPGTGGVLALRVNGTLTIGTGGGTGNISMNNNGYPTTPSTPGAGIGGLSGNTITGGRYSGTPVHGGGGGGHGTPSFPAIQPNSGGSGSQPSIPTFGGGSEGSDCAGLCFGSLFEKMVMGGSGGNNIVATDGTGGGIIFIAARNINILSGGGQITSSGQDGSAGTSVQGGGGGGAGGSIFLNYQNINNSNLLGLSVPGGPGGNGFPSPLTHGGGGGGAGRIHVNTCSGVLPSGAIDLSAGPPGSNPAGGVAPTPGMTGSIFTKTVTCN